MSRVRTVLSVMGLLILLLSTTATVSAHTDFHPYQVNLLSFEGTGLKYPTFIAMPSHGKKAYVVFEDSGHIGEIDLDMLSVTRAFITEPEPYRITLSPDERYVLAAGDKWVTVVDLQGAGDRPFEATPTMMTAASVGLCMFPCGVSNEVASDHGTTGYSLTSVAVGQDNTLYVGKIDRETNEHSLIVMDLNTDRLTHARNMGHDHAGGHDHTGAVDAHPIVPVIDWEANGNDLVLGVSEPDGIALSKDGTWAYVVNQEESKLEFVNLETEKIEFSVYTGIPYLTTPFEYIPHPGDSLDVVLSPDDKYAYVSNTRSGSVAVVDLATRKVTKYIKTAGDLGGPYGLAISKDGKHLYGAMWGMNELQVIDVAAGKVVQRINVGTAPIGVAVTPDGKRVLVANSRDNSLSIVTFLEQ